MNSRFPQHNEKGPSDYLKAAAFKQIQRQYLWLDKEFVTNLLHAEALSIIWFFVQSPSCHLEFYFLKRSQTSGCLSLVPGNTQFSALMSMKTIGAAEVERNPGMQYQAVL